MIQYYVTNCIKWLVDFAFTFGVDNREQSLSG